MIRNTFVLKGLSAIVFGWTDHGMRSLDKVIAV